MAWERKTTSSGAQCSRSCWRSLLSKVSCRSQELVTMRPPLSCGRTMKGSATTSSCEQGDPPMRWGQATSEHLLAFWMTRTICQNPNEHDPCTISWLPHWRQEQGSSCTQGKPAFGTGQGSDLRISTTYLIVSTSSLNWSRWISSVRRSSSRWATCKCSEDSSKQEAWHL